MEVNLDKRYPLEVDAGRAWQVLRDVPRVAGCMPGATITEQVDATHYKGTVKVKVGPASAAFGGDIEVQALDEATRSVQLLGKGADRGGSSASMQLTATVEPGESAGTSVLVGKAAVIVNGKFAQFGGRMMVQVSDMLLAQFVDNFRAEAATLPAPVVSAPEAPERAAEADAAPGVAPAAPVVQSASVASAPSAPGTPPSAPAAPRAAREINGLAILWGLVKSWFAGLLRRQT